MLLQARVVLDTMICMFSQYCQEPFTCEKCDVVTASGEVCVYPDIKSRQEKVDVKKVNSLVGINQPADTIANSLTRMCLSAAVENDQILVIISNQLLINSIIFFKIILQRT